MFSAVKLILTTAVLALLVGCGSMTSTPPVVAQANDRWVLLPVKNLSTTPSAGEKVLELAETQLRARGVTQISSYAPTENLSLVALLDNSDQQKSAQAWARESGAQYALSGTVHEWHYKLGADREPAVGLSMKLIEVSTGNVLWQGSAARTGWGYSNLSGIGDKVVRELLKQVRLSSAQ